MAKGNPFENYSEYVPPTSPPKARVPKSDHKSVKLDPAIDRRLARTQISHRQKKRLSRSYTLTAFAAGALGALVASLVYVFAIAGDEPAESEARPNPRPVVPAQVGAASTPVSKPAAPRSTSPLFVSTSEPRAVKSASEPSANSSDRTEAGSAPPLRSPVAGDPVREKRPAAEARPQAPPNLHSETPPPEAAEPNSAKTQAEEPTAPRAPEPPAATPSATGSSKVWVETPPRKVWVQ